ncbi:hypothetical protein [Lentzea flava]|uniref:Uncharacterized protein n=1 Tax=Lentzea flava TaxID=103732 RepID=A0ABQ2VAZ4_9PSEU|nr:hypothetical protein [Lentzea flava]MCP2204107.1 hypothetical protein [Lentzea flava]GGU74114.1 hypothetical protein GCM10010178_76900 [Lentzea flava]
MEILLTILLQPHVMVLIAIVVVFYALLPERRARARAKAIAEQSPALTELAAELGGTLSGPGMAAAWSPRLQHSKYRAELTLDFQRGPWHVHVTEACNPRPVMSDNVVLHQHWIEVATMPLPKRTVKLEFFELSFEDGFVHVVGQGQVRSDELVFLVDMILETLDLMPGVEPRDPTAVV